MFKKKETHLTQNRGVLKEMSKIIKTTLTDFDSPVEVVDAIEGYRQYHFYLTLKKPVRMKTMKTFEDDLRYALSNNGVEIQAPIPNEKLIGVTVNKKEDAPVMYWKDVINSDQMKGASPLTVPLGVDEFGTYHLANIAKMPHLLIAGTTGSGKSILLHSIINSLIERNSPDEVRLILGDPKRVELTQYEGLPHLLTAPLTSAKKTIQALSWAVKEMERRYDILEAEGKMNISLYHKSIYKPAREVWVKLGSKDAERQDLPEALPYIVIILDELNDLMQAYPSELESLVIKLAQMARGVGIHMIIATQRPSVNVITGSMKANLPARIALAVVSQIDSRTIIDTPGAEKLRGQGDMLYLRSDDPKPVRMQCFHFPEADIEARVNQWIKASQGGAVETSIFEEKTNNDGCFNTVEGGDDELYGDAKQAVIEAGKASTSYIQRKLRIGYSRAARLLDMLEERGVIGPADGSRPREVRKEPETVECLVCVRQAFCIEHDPLLEIQYNLARKAVIKKGKVSTSFLQKQFKIGYLRAAALIDLLEINGVIGPANATKSRKVLVSE